MKKLLLLIFIPSFIFSQEPNVITTFEFGSKPLKINELDVTLSYIDESPSPDYFATDFTLEPSSSVNYFSIGFMQDNFKEKFLMGLKADLFFKQMFGFNLDLSGGYLINANDNFKFGPKVDVTLFGIANKNIGELQNNTGYIQVNDTKFYDNEVKVSFQNVWFGLKPSFFAMFSPTKAFNVFANVGYSLNASLVNIGFSGEGFNENENTSATENLDADNLTFTINHPLGLEDPKKEAKFGFNGVNFSFGIGINFNQLKK
ncbi:MAG: hypothetical protein CL851_01505 [Crocinitomicaceae bacterium]|nr:hypothetical protein [Crocinitomicaceae bacterium]|tara:strand:+ start:236 stop:1012 length:777 start_codon:yes stop_codon:yes gene_type:complete